MSPVPGAGPATTGVSDTNTVVPGAGTRKRSQLRSRRPEEAATPTTVTGLSVSFAMRAVPSFNDRRGPRGPSPVRTTPRPAAKERASCRKPAEPPRVLEPRATS